MSQVLSAIEQSSSIIMITDTRGDLVYVSPTFEKISGYESEEVLGKNPRFLKTGFTKQEDYRELWNSIKAGDSWTGRFKNRKKSGEIYWVRQTISPVFNSNNQITNYISVQDEISSEIKTEEHRNSLIKELKRSNEELESFATVISHDLKSHLHVISGLTSLLKEKNDEMLDSDSIQMLDIMKERIEVVNNLIVGVLSHAMAGKLEEKRDVYSSKDIIEEVIKSIKIPDRVKINIQETLPYIYYNYSLFFQIISNLMVNAIVHAGKQLTEIEISCTDRTDMWEFQIKDDGQGIQHEDFKMIFQLFGKGSHTNKSKTSGIGLSIVKKIVDKNDGEIWVNSSPGYGTSFNFTIPKTIRDISEVKLLFSNHS